MKIGFVGLTHLGLNYLVAAAEKGFRCVGYDFDNEKIKKLNNNKFDFFEPRFDFFFKKNKKKILFTNVLKKLNKCDLIFLGLDIQTNNKSISDYKELLFYLSSLRKKINKKKILVILSQVQPGFIRNINWSKNNLYYQVETLIFGDAVNRSINPEQIIIGSNTVDIHRKLKIFYKKFTKNLNVMNYEEAELSKIAINLFLVNTLTFTNYLSEFCEKIKGCRWERISSALREDKRIGKFSYLKPGLGITSANLLRDIYSFKKILSNIKQDQSLIKYWIRNSLKRQFWIHNLLKKIKNKRNIKNVIIFGIPYKENTSSIQFSPTISIIKSFNDLFFCIYDPVIKKITLRNKNYKLIDNYRNNLRGKSILILATPWKDFKTEVFSNDIEKNFKGNYIIDPYGILKIKNKKINYFRLGEKNK
jgi:UDPglucose 6-dehydrogenase